MEKSFVERIESYPELKKHIEQMLCVAENIGGKADKANDAEILVVNNMRKIGAAARWIEEHSISLKQGKKFHWETTIGQREIVVQRFLHEQKLVVPFIQAAEIDCRAYSILLEWAIVDFGSDVSFRQTVDNLKEHYGISVALSAFQSITKHHAAGNYAMQEKEADIAGKKNACCLIGEMDGAMIPIVIFEANESADKRKWRKTGWKEV